MMTAFPVTHYSFKPTDISSLALWLDASDLTTITQVSNAVSQWNDKSGNARNATQSTGANQPITGTRTLNGRNVLDFNGSSHTMNYTGISPASGLTVFYMASHDTVGTVQTLIGGASGSAAFGLVNTNTHRIVKTAVVQILAGTATITGGSISFYTATTQSSGNKLFLAGAADNSNATNPSYTANTSSVGSGSLGTQFFDGRVAEVVIYTKILSNPELNLVGQYMAQKWGRTWTTI